MASWELSVADIIPFKQKPADTFDMIEALNQAAMLQAECKRLFTAHMRVFARLVSLQVKIDNHKDKP